MDSARAGLATYRRVVEQIKDEIRSGARQPGDRLPGNRRLAEDFRVSLGTAQKALRVLQDEGWVVTTPAVGVFVATDRPSDPIHDLDDLRAEVQQLRRITDDLGARLDRIEGNTQGRG
ncbi:winged helix-turn-helix domain-containing protein [Nocardia sp. NPDC047648]|uniref:GntR family transcriptional regulator n=1 Tax=Nocardia sp. NPDC047648 TaxID=3155625 RepID=UPI0033D12E6A